MIKNFTEYEKMSLVEQKMWWYTLLHDKVLNLLCEYKIEKEALIFDLGCGTGGLMEKLSFAGYPNVIGMDISEHALSFCKKKTLMCAKVI